MQLKIEKANQTKAGIYKITNLHNGRFYIGSAKNLSSRYKSHHSSLRRNKHHNQYLQNDWNKYKDTAIYEFTAIQFTSEEQRLLVEQKWLDKLFDDPGCCNHKRKVNSKPRSRYSNTPEETGRKISEIRKRNWKDLKYRKEQTKKLKKYAFKPKTCTFISPEGNVTTITNYSEFCRNNPQYRKQGFVGLGLEKTKSYKGWTKYKPTSKKIIQMNKNGAKTWWFRNPAVEEIKIINLLKFCRENSLSCPSMHMVHSGKRKSHKGWTKANAW